MSMNSGPSRIQLLAQRDNIIRQSSGRGLDVSEKEQLASANQLLHEQGGARRNVQQILQGGTGESLGLVGNQISLGARIADRDRALQALTDVDLPAIQAQMIQMTGYTPTNLPTTTLPYSNPDPTSVEAAIRVSALQDLKHDATRQKMVFRFFGLHSADVLECNADFFAADPEEARGVCFHELGHVWSSKIVGLGDQRSETYIEAFGELFRSAAALNENAQWAQATGCSGYDVLYGSEVPNLVIPHWQNQKIPNQLYNAGRFLVCNRLVEHLGGLDESTLHHLSKALDAGELPYNGGNFEDALRAIEAETGKRGFADAVLQDPALRFGGMKPGPLAVGMPAAGGNGYRIECFNIDNVGEKWGQSRQDFSEAPEGSMDVNSGTFHFEGVQTEAIPFSMGVRCDQFDIGLNMDVTSGEVVLTPEQILDLGVRANLGFPAGEYKITVEVLGKPAKILGTKINITEADRQKFQRKRGVRFPH